MAPEDDIDSVRPGLDIDSIRSALNLGRVHNDHAWLLAHARSLMEEVDRLRAVCAYEARVVEAHVLDLKAIKGGRRDHIQRSVDRLRWVVRGSWPRLYDISGRSFIRERQAVESRR